MPREITCTDHDLTRIRQLLQTARPVLSGKRFRQLQMIEQLCLRRKGTEIAASMTPKVSAQAVNRLKQELLNPGELASRLIEIETFIQTHPVQRNPSRRGQRGRPGYAAWDNLEESVHVDDEPVLEIASVFLTPSVQHLVLAVRMSAPIHDLIRTPLADGMSPAYWSHVSGFDWMAAKIIGGLAEGVSRMEGDEPGIDPLSIRPLRARFPKDFTLYILQQSLAPVPVIPDRLQTDESDRSVLLLEPGVSPFLRLEQIIHSVRARYSCVGLLPCLRELFEESLRWESENYRGAFVWHTDRNRVEEWLRRRRVSTTYLAAGGYLFDLRPALWQILPYRNHVNLGAIRVRTKVRTVSEGTGVDTHKLVVQPLPETAVMLGDLAVNHSEEMVQKYREDLRKSNPHARLIYAADARHRNLRFPSALTEALPGDQTSQREIDGRAVVLVPRHYLLPVPEVNLEILASLTEPGSAGIRYMDVLHNNEERRVLVGTVPSLIAGIEESFLANRYGDAHREMLLYQERFRTAQSRYRRQVDHRRVASLFQLDPFSGPYYHFSVPDLSHLWPEGPELPPSDQPLHSRLAHRVNTLGRKHQRGDPAAENLRWPPGSGEYSSHRTMLAVLTEFDADFLLLGISAAIRADMDEQGMRWADKLRQIIIDHFYPAGSGGKLNLAPVRATVPLWTGAKDEDLTDGFNDALAAFHGSRQRSFLRGAVENAQRLALAGYKPAAVVVETDEALLRSWRSYLGQRLKGKLSDLAAHAHEPGWPETESGQRSVRHRRKTSQADDEPDFPFWDEELDDPAAADLM